MTDQPTRVLQVGAGSMGKRRLRDLTARADVQVHLLETRPDRADEAAARFHVPVHNRLEDALAWEPQVLCISTPPDHHDPFIELALDRRLHHFCEANVWTYDHARVRQISESHHLVSAPSCSLHFLPLVRELRRVVHEELGPLQTYQMMLSTWMPGWHPQEGMEFYARNRATTAAREMVPFELLYLNHVFGLPVEVSGSVARRGRLPYETEDTWSLQMELQHGGCAQLTVLMASPGLCRSGVAFGANGWIAFDLVDGTFQRHLPEPGLDDLRSFGPMTDILEDVYRDELNTFIDAVHGRADWPHSYYHSSIATAALAAAERSALSGHREAVDPSLQPELLPAGSPSILQPAS